MASEHIMRAKPSATNVPEGRVPIACLAVFALAWLALAIEPRYREDWLLENLPTFVFVPALIGTHRRFRFSDRAYVQMTVFLLLHTVGSHYTYSEVPLGGWLEEGLGVSRNHYDRVVHFAFGLLFVRPLLELSLREANGAGRIAVLVTSLAGVSALSVSYEILEWATAAIVDPAAGVAFLGTQGDPWDAQKDMALACGGALVAALVEPASWGRSVHATLRDRRAAS